MHYPRRLRRTYRHATQCSIAAAAALVIAGLLWQQYSEEGLYGSPWLLGGVVITALLLIAAWPTTGLIPTVGKHSNKQSLSVSVEKLYSSGRNQSDAFFREAAKKAPDPRVQKKLQANHAHLVRVFAYLGPKFILNMKIKDFDRTAAARELSVLGQRGFAALADFEDEIFARQLTQIGGGILRPDTNQGVRLAQGVMQHLNSVFEECSERLITQAEHPLDPLFREFDRFGPLANDAATERDGVYRPLINRYFDVWKDADFAPLKAASPKA